MAAMAAVLVVALATAGCSDGPSLMPTSPTTPAAPPTATASAGRVLRTEAWELELTLRGAAGPGGCEADVGHARRVDLGMDFRDSGEVVMYYDRHGWPTAHSAEWSGFVYDEGFEGSGFVYEPGPCEGARSDPVGTPTTLTGYFSEGGRTFTGTEMRRSAPGPAGETVYYFEWHAARRDP